MEFYGDDGEILEGTDRIGNLDSTLDETERDSETRDVDIEMEDDGEENATLGDDSGEEVDSPRASLPPFQKGRFSRRKRKRGSSEESSVPDTETDAAKKARGPLSNTNKSINVGDEYQAIIEDYVIKKDPDEDRDREDCEWRPNELIDDETLVKYVKEKSLEYITPIDKVLYSLLKNNFDFEKTTEQISRRSILTDGWLDDEKSIFQNTLYHVGKNFHQIQAAVHHRSLRSIIQYYYESKKSLKYKQFVANQSKTDSLETDDDDSDSPPYTDALFDNMCENCGEKAERMEINPRMNRRECFACLIYFKLMGVPRPTSLRLVLDERMSNDVQCPTKMREIMQSFDRLRAPADGKIFEKRRMELKRTKNIKVKPVTCTWRIQKGLLNEYKQVFPDLANFELQAKESRLKPFVHLNGIISIENGDSEVKKEIKEEEVPKDLVAPHIASSEEKSESLEISEISSENVATESVLSEAKSEETMETTQEAINDLVSNESLSDTPIENQSAEMVSTKLDAEFLEEKMETEVTLATVADFKSPEKAANGVVAEISVTIKSSELPPKSPGKSNGIVAESSVSLTMDAESSENSIAPITNGHIPKDSAETPVCSSEPGPSKPKKPSCHVWYNKHRTVCMEEIEAIAEDSRRKFYEACQFSGRVDTKEVAEMKTEMEGIRDRVERSNYDLDLIPSFVFSDERVRYQQEWSEREKSDAERSFNWYAPHFEHIADVLGTKTSSQVYEFYLANRKKLDDGHTKYENEILPKVARADLEKMRRKEA